MKTCTKCHIEKDESEFYKNKRTKDGLYSHCKSCKNKDLSTWSKNNRERLNLIQNTSSTCKILRNHAADLENDPERLTTDFIIKTCRIERESGEVQE